MLPEFCTDLFYSVLRSTHNFVFYLGSRILSLERPRPVSIWTIGPILTKYFARMVKGKPNGPILHWDVPDDVWKGWTWSDLCLLLELASNWKIADNDIFYFQYFEYYNRKFRNILNRIKVIVSSFYAQIRPILSQSKAHFFRF